MVRKYLNKKTVGGALFAALILLIFFSKTIYTYNLPVVTAASPQRGKLSKLEIVSGTVDWRNTEQLFTPVAGTVQEIMVREGDSVTAGQELLRLSFDSSDAEQKLEELKNSRSKLNVDIQNINVKIEKLRRNIEAVEDESYEKEEVSDYDLTLVQIEIRKARAEYRDTKDRYDDGDATEVELQKARYALQTLELKQENLEKTMGEEKEKAKENLEKNEKDKAKRLADYQSDLDALKLDLNTKNIDLNSLALQEAPYKKALENFEEYATIKAENSGVVVSLPVSKGETLKEDQLLATFGVDSDFEINCTISADNNFVVQGDACTLSNTSHALEGTVTYLNPSAQGKDVTILVQSDEVMPGETFEIRFKKDSTTTYTLVANGALNKDNDGYFLYQLKRRDGIMGKEYYVDRLGVYIGDSDSSNTVIVQGINFFEPIVLTSDKSLSVGDTVSISNEGDFFES